MITRYVLFSAVILGFVSLNAYKASDVRRILDSSLLEVSKCDARRADFTGAKLLGKLFLQVDFSGADLSSAELYFSHFIQCKFRGAIFSKTDLGSAVFEDCDMQGVNLSTCAYDKATFCGKSSKGLILFSAQASSVSVYEHLNLLAQQSAF